MGKYGNIEKMIGLGLSSWRSAAESGLVHIRTKRMVGNRLETVDGHQFINMVSCSYLGLNRHPKILEGAMEGVRREGTMTISVSRARIAPELLTEVESLLSTVFDCDAVVTISCTAASLGVLPVLASGHLTDNVKPYMIFDKNCHFSMNIAKALCGDETEVAICDHNDIAFIEDACKRHQSVAYVADGAYSMGGSTPIFELKSLQEKYGLFLFLDDSHSISVCGDRGIGFVRSQFDKLGDRTIIVASLAKAFGATGGVIMLGNARQRELLDYFGGPLGWSQMVNPAGLGAIKASAEIHLTSELVDLQKKLRSVMDDFDSMIPTANAGNGLPIRIVNLSSAEEAINVSAKVFKRGFYTSAVFFPIVAQGKAGLRAMGRADMSNSDIAAFCDAIKEFVEQ